MKFIKLKSSLKTIEKLITNQMSFTYKNDSYQL